MQMNCIELETPPATTVQYIETLSLDHTLRSNMWIHMSSIELTVPTGYYSTVYSDAVCRLYLEIKYVDAEEQHRTKSSPATTVQYIVMLSADYTLRQNMWMQLNGTELRVSTCYCSTVYV
jgi:hypothetical protein